MGTILTGVAIVFAVSVAVGALVALLVRIVVLYPRCWGHRDRGSRGLLA